MSAERHIIKSLVFQGQPICPVAQRPRDEGTVHLVIQYFKQNHFWYDDIEDGKCDQYMKVKESACVLYPFQFSSVQMSWILLKRMGLPQSDHPPIFENLIQFAERATFVSDLPIFLLIIDINVCSTGSVDYQAIVDYVKRCPVTVSDKSFRPGAPINVVARESILLVTDEDVPSNRPIVAVDSRRVDNLIPNYRSSICGLKEVRLDDLEDVIRENPSCAICLNNFAECADSERITGLPCAHHYHVHCIVNWLEVNHTCPMCRRRYPDT